MLYVVRHCKATGQEPDSPLTEEGVIQAKNLAAFFQKREVSKIVSSPFARAVSSIEPFSEQSGIPVEIDERLRERVLSSENLEDWREKLERTFVERDLVFAGGESSSEAAGRGLEMLGEQPDN